MTAGGEAAGVRGSAELTAFAEATVGGDPDAIATARAAVRTALGDEATVDAAAVIGNFQRMVRIADGTGIPLDKPVAMLSADLREDLGIDHFDSASETPEVGAIGRLAGKAMQRAFPLVTKVLRFRD